MSISQLSLAVLPMVTLAISVASIYFYYKRKCESDLDKELKQLRQLLISGKLDKKKFLLIRNRLHIDNVFSEQSYILENFFKDEKIDSNT